MPKPSDMAVQREDKGASETANALQRNREMSLTLAKKSLALPEEEEEEEGVALPGEEERGNTSACRGEGSAVGPLLAVLRCRCAALLVLVLSPALAMPNCGA
jgi:hypothetical protein